MDASFAREICDRINEQTHPERTEWSENRDGTLTVSLDGRAARIRVTMATGQPMAEPA